MNARLNEIIYKDADLTNALCNEDYDCPEKKRVKTNPKDGRFEHIRVDGVLISTTEKQKSDCLR